MNHRVGIGLTGLAMAMALLVPVVAEEASLLRKAKGKDLKRENPLAQDPEAAAGGKRLYERYCAKCHGGNAKAAERGPALDRGEVREAPAGALYWVIRNGGGKMPSWGELPEPQRWQIITYLKSQR
ncbi:MAG: cytochrome c [Acidobacteriales bacterium]|nr:cytochrome c [Terriglobales bacterium]